MQCGLFSIFDPSFFEGWELKWVLVVLLFIFLFQLFSMKFGGIKAKILWALFKALSQGFSDTRKGFFLLLSVAVLIVFLGSVGLIPFTFALTSHLAFTLSLSLTLWVISVILGLVLSPKEKVAHLLPKGSPPILWPFLVLVETVSLLIRPFTLAIRLMANVMAGHLILSLIGKGVASYSFGIFSMSMSTLFLGFEVCVTLVQAYVFVSLLSLYWGE